MEQVEFEIYSMWTTHAGVQYGAHHCDWTTVYDNK
jgi:hypothetical protein